MSRSAWSISVALATMVLTAAPALAWPRSSLPEGAADRVVRDVLSDPAFDAAAQGLFERLRQQVRQWFVERLAALFESGAGTLLAWVLVGLAVVVGVMVVVRWLGGVRRGATSPAGPEAVVVTRRPAADWLEDARTARAAGDLAESVRCGYRAVVAALDRRGDLEEVPGRTVGEYRRQVGRNARERLDSFTRASDVFERVWYAQRPATQDDVATVIASAVELT